MKYFDRAVDLPASWDDFTEGNIYLSKNILDSMERVSDCKPKYFMHYDKEELIACFMLFEKRHNLFTLHKWPNIQAKINFIYLLLSANAPGIKFSQDIGETLNNISGLKAVFNLKEGENLSSFAKGVYLPSMTLANRWESLDEYLDSIRSGYRYRYRKALKLGSVLNKRILKSNEEFTKEMYGLYEQVYNNSDYKLEKLSYDFFKNDFSKIVVFELNNLPVAFVQLIEDKDRLIFEFGGFNYQLNHQYDLYINMLLAIVQYGIENNFKVIDFGQTAEDAKMKLGCKMDNRYIWIGHSNKILNYLIKRGIVYLSYKQKFYNFNVFK